MTTDAAFLRNLADLSSGKASARLREIADMLDMKAPPGPDFWGDAGCDLHDWRLTHVCAECGWIGE